VTGHLGLGSNVGDRRANLQAAVDALRERGVTPTASSSVYETAPVGEHPDQRSFFNACLAVETELEPDALLDACKDVERSLGRITEGAGYVHHGPRPIDVDILALGDRIHTSPRLTVPHAEVTARRFVLVPLTELAPDLELPGRGRAADALAALGPGEDVRLAEPPLSV
jgi:2-amino-4-hydroxy-6-hydroxymethyldihydropteridine diphosphokinase